MSQRRATPPETSGGRCAPARLRLALVSLALGLALPWVGSAQIANPVYLDDSPAAEEGLHRAREMAQGSNLAEAARVLQKLLDEEGERVTPSASDADLYVAVRARAHLLLRGAPALLRRYREVEEPTARRMLDDGAHAEAERTRLLTTSGFIAAVRVGWSHFERARFWGALRAVEPLEDHPDIASNDARIAEARSALGALAAEIARRIDDDAGRTIAERIARAAGAPVGALEKADAPEIVAGVTPLSRAARVTTDGLLSKPLWSESLTGSPASLDDMPEPEQPADGSPFTTAAVLRVLPAVAGDLILVNTGQELSAWDRLTLTARWKRREYPGPPEDAMRGGASRGLASAFKDASTVTAWGPWAGFTTGVARDGRREGDARVHVVETATGRELWAVNVAGADPSLLESWARGPIVIDQNVLVVAAYKFSQQRRLSSVQLLGFEAATGELLWRRPLGSAGVAPYGAPTMEAADAGAVARGAVLRTDRLGVISSIDIATGRVVWARRWTPDATARRDSQPWESHAPIASHGRVYTLTPDRRALLELDELTGALLGQVSAAALGEPEYLVEAAGLIGCVQAEQVVMVEPPLPAPGDAAAHGAEGGARAWRAVRVAEPPNIRGRVVGADDRLLVPVVDGVLVAPTRPAPGAQAQRLRLDRPGAIVVLPDQLVVADDYQVHTYLLWGVAERMLSERIHAEPDDPSPAVTYAELAHRAGRLEAILPAADLAAGAILRGAGSERAENARRRLFASIIVMLDNPGAHKADPETPPEARVGAGLPEAVAAGLVERAGALANDPQERAAALLVSGAFAENRGQPARAALAYQTALTDPALASSTYARPGASTRADLEASRRLRRLVASHGRAVYAPFDAEAERALAATRSRPASAADFESVAAQYPVSPAGARALLLAADLYERGGETGRAALAVEQALLASRDALIDDRALLGEIHGRLVRVLDATGRPRAALAALARARADRTSLSLTERGAPLDFDALERSLTSRLAALERRPAVGDLVPDQTPQALSGWRLVEPVITTPLTPADRALLYSTQSGEIACQGPAEGGAPGVRTLWTMAPAPGLKVVRVDAEWALISEDRRAQAPPPERGPAPPRNSVLKRIDLRDGRVAWETPPFRSLFDPETERQPRGNANRTPVVYTPRGALPATDTLVAADGRTVVLVERSGRAAAFDAQTGATLWTNPSLMRRVHDVWADAGALAVVGQEVGPDDREDRVFGAPIVLALDARTGRTLHREVSALGQARWVRVTPAGRVISGHDSGLSCVDAFGGMSRWRVQDARVRGTDDAWVFAGRCAIIDDEDAIWQVSEDDGRVRAQALDTRGLRRPAAIATLELGDRAAFLTTAGLAIFDPAGKLVGRDARWGVGPTLPGAWADGQFVTIDSATANPTATDSFLVRRLSAETGALLGRQAVRLGATPEVIAVMDGRVLVTAGDATLVYDAPARAGARGDEPPRPGAEPAPIPYPEPAAPPDGDAPEPAEVPAQPQR